MSYLRDFLVPLSPFSIDLLARVTLISDQNWWQYIDATTLILTFSFWSLFLISQTPNESPIKTDQSVEDDIANLHSSLMLIVIVGFITFGIVSICKILSISLPEKEIYFEQNVFFYLTCWTIMFCAFTVALLFVKHKSISKLARK